MPTVPSRALLTGAALAMVAAGAVRAETSVQVGEVLVTGRLEETLPQELSRYGSRIEVVTGERLQAAGYTDVGQALQNEVPGLQLTPQSGPFSYNTASFQGSRPGEILYLIDGVRISNRLYNTTPPLDTVPAHMVERIEVLEGGQGLFFGTQAVAGVVNIVSRDFTDDPHGRLEIGGDTNRAVSASAYASGAFGGHRLVAFASHDQARGYQVFPHGEYQPSGTDRHRGYRMDSVGAKYAHDLGDRARFSASYTHTEGFAELARPNLVSDARNERNEELAWAKLDVDATEALSLFVKGYWHDWDSRYDQTNNTPTGPRVVSDGEVWTFKDYGLNAVGRWALQPGAEVWAGYDVQRYGGRDDVLIIAPRKETAQAVFGQIRLGPQVLPRTHLAAGLRYNMANETADRAVWNVSGSYDLTDALFVRGAVGTSFRLPDAEQLFAQDPLENGEIGNRDLKPERARNLNLSAGWRSDVFTAELVGFWRETKDLISLDGETADPDVLQFINVPGKVKARGFELVASGRPAPWLTLNGSYTHARTRQTGSALQLTGVAKDFAKLGAELRPAGERFGAGASFNWVGDIYDSLPSGLGRQNRGNYGVLDLNAWVGLGERGRLQARLENALDADYATLTRRFFKDSGPAFVGHFRGVPRTLHVSYAHAF